MRWPHTIKTTISLFVLHSSTSLSASLFLTSRLYCILSLRALYTLIFLYPCTVTLKLKWLLHINSDQIFFQSTHFTRFWKCLVENLYMGRMDKLWCSKEIINGLKLRDSRSSGDKQLASHPILNRADAVCDAVRFPLWSFQYPLIFTSQVTMQFWGWAELSCSWADLVWLHLFSTVGVDKIL